MVQQAPANRGDEFIFVRVYCFEGMHRGHRKLTIQDSNVWNTDVSGACHERSMWQRERCQQFIQGRVSAKQWAQFFGVSLCLLGSGCRNHYSGMDCRQWESCAHIYQASIRDSLGLSIWKLVLLECRCRIMFVIQPSFEGTKLIYS